ncbi:hypothetical protein SUGI_0827270 [Cryptomeria japonica]|uniref:trihelix transcription factor GTL1 n=1 Tax=Cryptomeria japonica TaxID=3369 RepID=UPI002414A19D|nr:trihelix transcription factor GTL1 [Cryptomeria japonica]GLJ40270.1 hypothetical protein SUGI_0827270 [Cryptomeria japonica]
MMVEALEMVNSSPSHQNNDEVNSSHFISSGTSIVPYVCAEKNPPPPPAAETEEDDKKHKKRSKNWTRVETLKLIKLRSDLEPRFSRSGRKTELWDEIAEALHKEHFSRDAQQCRDKWEKLMASFKDVREGLKDSSENPYYDDLHPLLSAKSLRREKDFKKESEFVQNSRPPEREMFETRGSEEEEQEQEQEQEDDEFPKSPCLRKRKRGGRLVSITDITAVKTLVETVISRQQRFFRELLESLERKDQIREQMRLERDDKWREEELAHRNVFNNAMMVLAQKLLPDKGLGSATAAGPPVAPPPPPPPAMGNSLSIVSASDGPRPKKRSKNWKRGEVLLLIKLRGEMDARFANSARRAALWDELAEALGTQGIKRDGKQCREKWDKLMAAYKDVIDGKREEGDLSYFMELKAIVGGKPDEGKLQTDIIA